MSWLGGVKRFLHRVRTGEGVRRRPRHGGDALGRTAKDGLHVFGRASGAGTQVAHDRVAEGADDYDRSFDD